jgi:hypothetical protein
MGTCNRNENVKSRRRVDRDFDRPGMTTCTKGACRQAALVLVRFGRLLPTLVYLFCTLFFNGLPRSLSFFRSCPVDPSFS